MRLLKRDLHPSCRRVLLLTALLVMMAGLLGWLIRQDRIRPTWLGGQPVTGVVWQLHNATVAPRGSWHRLGVDTLLLQWIEVDGTGFVPGVGDPAPRLPDWEAIAREPWARHVVLGLAGNFSERKARRNILELARRSARISRTKLPLNVNGYYFPVEVDPTWAAAPEVMTEALALLPRPLWISVYDSANTGGDALANWLAAWLPDDVGVFLQDGVGVEVRTPRVARQYADALAARLGKDRVRVIVEAFRPGIDRLFRPATPDELAPQIKAMRGYQIYLFDGPNYVDDDMVEALRDTL